MKAVDSWVKGMALGEGKAQNLRNQLEQVQRESMNRAGQSRDAEGINAHQPTALGGGSREAQRVNIDF
jgi:hypothetical protein